MATPTINTAAQALAWSRARSTFQAAMCARHVVSALTDGLRKTYGVADADAVWARATQRETSRTPPAGAPVYWASGEFGHIALSVGGGRVRSTDVPVDGRLGECSIEEMGRRWPRMTYRGWSRDLCGDPIPGLEKAAPIREDDTMTPEQEARILAAIAGAPEKVWRHPIANRRAPKAKWSAQSWLEGGNLLSGDAARAGAQTLALVKDLASRAGVDVDEEAIALEVVRLVGPGLREALVSVLPTVALDSAAGEVADAVLERLGLALVEAHPPTPAD